MPRAEDERRDDVPSTVARSDEHAQEIWKKTHDSAVETYGEGERAHRTAYASLKHSYEKKGDRWVPKGQKGPSDPRAGQPTGKAARGEGETFGGIDYYGHTKAEFEQRARELGIRGFSRMKKDELVRAIARKERNEERRGRKAA
jgi:cation transport regulator ChaB